MQWSRWLQRRRRRRLRGQRRRGPLLPAAAVWFSSERLQWALGERRRRRQLRWGGRLLPPLRQRPLWPAELECSLLRGGSRLQRGFRRGRPAKMKFANDHRVSRPPAGSRAGGGGAACLSPRCSSNSRQKPFKAQLNPRANRKQHPQNAPPRAVSGSRRRWRDWGAPRDPSSALRSPLPE